MAGTIHEINDKNIITSIREDAARAASELAQKAGLKKGMTVIIGCSTSETLGEDIGSWSVPEAGAAILEGLKSVFCPMGVNIAAQCCEHLNRAVITDRKNVSGEDIVNVVPQPKAGGSFATALYNDLEDPCAVEEIKADAGLDIGGTLIGMHLKKVAVPVKLTADHVGKAHVTAARVRPKFIGGSRAAYDESLM